MIRTVVVPDPECYKEFGADLDSCSRQENQGCKGCRCAKEIIEEDKPLNK
jgi:hypothetical protein